MMKQYEINFAGLAEDENPTWQALTEVLNKFGGKVITTVVIADTRTFVWLVLDEEHEDALQYVLSLAS